MSVKNIGQLIHVVPLLAPVSVEATTSTAGINMGLFDKVEFLVSLGACSGDTHVLTVEECTATGGTSADAITFHYRVSAAAGTDTMGADTTAATLPLTYTTFAGKTVIIDVDSSMLTDTHNYVRVTLTDPTNAVALCSIVALCYPRYPQDTPSLALT